MNNNQSFFKALNDIANSIYILFLLIVIYISINAIYAITYNNILADLIVAAFIILFLMVISFKYKINSFNFNKLDFSKKYFFIVACVLGVLLIQFLNVELNKIFPNQFSIFYKIAYGSSGSGLAKTNDNFMIVDSLILAPILEEFVFRFILFNSVEKRFKNHHIVFFISSFSFGLFHVLSFINEYNFQLLITNYVFWIYFAIKILFGYYFVFIYDKTRNIYINIFFHFLSNLIATFL